MFETGLDVFLKKEHRRFRKMRLGVLCNQASVDGQFRHVSHLLTDKKLRLNITCFLGPQHGIRGEKQDNMVESQDFIDPLTRLPVFSLYSHTRVPGDEILSRFDALVVDLQDVGTRIYTFIYTLANCMRAAKAGGKKIIVLDRPNPINGVDTEGNILEEEFTSFVGQFPMPVRHGMTIGELALLFNEHFEIGCDLEVIKMRQWKRAGYWEDTKRAWVPPSPNVPTVNSVVVFPGSVLFEGTNVSEGRGTTTPFEWIGAPFIKPDELAAAMNKLKLKGVYFRPVYFQPTYQKWKDEVCGGVFIHVLDRQKFRPFEAGVHLLCKIAKLYPKGFHWKYPPYEYEYERMPIDLIAGTSNLRETIDLKPHPTSFLTESRKPLSDFMKIRKDYLLYGKA